MVKIDYDVPITLASLQVTDLKWPTLISRTGWAWPSSASAFVHQVYRLSPDKPQKILLKKKLSVLTKRKLDNLDQTQKKTQTKQNQAIGLKKKYLIIYQKYSHKKHCSKQLK